MSTLYYDPAGEGDEYNGAYDEEHTMLIINVASEVVEDLEYQQDPIIETNESKIKFDQFLDNYIRDNLPAQDFIQYWMDYNFDNK